MENGRIGAGCQIFCKECPASKGVSSQRGKYRRPAGRYLGGQIVLFIFPGAGISVHDGAVSDSFAAGIGI